MNIDLINNLNLKHSLKSKSSELEDYDLVVNYIFDLIGDLGVVIIDFSVEELYEMNPLLMACYLRTMSGFNNELFPNLDEINKKLWNSLYVWTFYQLKNNGEDVNDALFGLTLLK